MSRYVVTVKPPDDHPGAVRVYGPFSAWVTANAFAEYVNAKVEASENMQSDDPLGWAYVQPLRGFGRRDAAAWALRGEMFPTKPMPMRPSPEREREIHARRFPNDPQHR